MVAEVSSLVDNIIMPYAMILQRRASVWSASWDFISVMTFLPVWYYLEFVPYFLGFSYRLVLYLRDFLSVKEVLVHFFKPWKNSNTLAGWVAGFLVKGIYASVVVPLWVLFSLAVFGLVFIVAMLPLGIPIMFILGWLSLWQGR